jgi:hypothetical protein
MSIHCNNLSELTWVNHSSRRVFRRCRAVGLGVGLSGLGLHCIFPRYQWEPNVYLSAFQMSTGSCNHNLYTCYFPRYQWGPNVFLSAFQMSNAISPVISESQTCICQPFRCRLEVAIIIWIHAIQVVLALHQNYKGPAPAFWTSDEARKAAEGRVPDSEFPTCQYTSFARYARFLWLQHCTM